jgi:5-methylthioadenosine/S-adenosylhomocysteine deaminase
VTSLLLTNCDWLVVGWDKWYQHGYVLVKEDKIVDVGHMAKMDLAIAPNQIIDCTGLVVMPGLINAHNHMYEIVCRGLGKTQDTLGWLKDLIYPVCKVLTPEDYYQAALLGAADCLSQGTTSVVSHLTNFARFHADQEMRAFQASGMRAVVARASSTSSVVDSAENGDPAEELEAGENFLERWSRHGRVSPALGPAGLFSCDPGTSLKLKEVAQSRDARYFIHLNETRRQAEMARSRGFEGEVAWAAASGLLDETTIVAHSVWSSDNEMRLLADAGSLVVHNPYSNMVMGSGIANLAAHINAGVRVSVATDGPASNDSQDMFAEMKAALALQRVHTLNPSEMQPEDVFRMATESGAQAMGHRNLGRIELGFAADLIGVAITGNPAMMPVLDPIKSLVYCASGRDVRMTIVSGDVVYRDGEFASIDLREVAAFVQHETIPRVVRAIKPSEKT